jgi:DASS family divalent anion:Na+ symporter
MTGHVTALYPAFLGAALAGGVPPMLAALALAYFSNVNAAMTHYGTGSAPVFFGAGYVGQGQWWRLLTAAFLHFGLTHLLMNVIILWQIGKLTERLFGHVGFTVAYVLAAVGASLAGLLWNPMAVSAGASGAVSCW